MKTLGELLRAARLVRNWTQNQLAEQMNVSRSTVSNWENNVAEPDFSTICRLSAVLRCNFVPRYEEIAVDLPPTDRKMRVILGDSSEITVKSPENACKITAGTVDLLINGSDFLGNAVRIHVTAPFSLEYPVEHS